ncbi:MAG: hypothetical protein ACOH2D_09365 [Gelidibacter sp.]|uniref:hypothetical protein n=1 Tax=Gelidibacter sp. TaxID=2018083 RepID=UPI00326521AE
MKKLLVILLFAYLPLLYAQEEKVYFDDALALHLRKFNNKSDLAIRNSMPNEVDTIFNSLVNNHLKNTYVSDLKLKKVSGGYLQTDKIDKPFLLITKNSAIIQTKEEIQTINTIANNYQGVVEIIVIYWDKLNIAKKNTKDYNKNVTVVYADERYNNSNRALSVYKHSFGVPTCFYINKDKQIFDIDRKFFLRNLKPETKEQFAEKTTKGISELLASHTDIAEHPIPKEDR